MKTYTKLTIPFLVVIMLNGCAAIEHMNKVSAQHIADMKTLTPYERQMMRFNNNQLLWNMGQSLQQQQFQSTTNCTTTMIGNIATTNCF